MNKTEKSAKPTDEYIRKELNDWSSYGTPDYWSLLERNTTDAELQRRCRERRSLAYRAEEYSAGIL